MDDAAWILMMGDWVLLRSRSDQPDQNGGGNCEDGENNAGNNMTCKRQSSRGCQEDHDLNHQPQRISKRPPCPRRY